MSPRELEIGDVVQLDPTMDDQRFAGCMMVVTEPKTWGAQGCIIGPHDGAARLFYYRAKFENFAFVGPANWVQKEWKE